MMQELQEKERVDGGGEDCPESSEETCHAASKTVEAEEMSHYAKYREAYSESRNEAELSQKWLNLLLRTAWNQNLQDAQYERNVIDGRCDIRLLKDGQPIAVIELKSPTKVKSESLKDHFLQVYKYAHSQYIWRKGVLKPILGFLSNGDVVIVFDGSLEYSEAFNSAVTLNVNESDFAYQRFIKSIKQLKSDEKTEFNKKDIIRSNKEKAKSADQNLADHLYRCYEKCKEITKNEHTAFQMVLQLYLIAICRDCGFIPTPKIREYELEHNWSGIIEELKTIFSEDFITFSAKESKRVWEIYDLTRNFPVRLDYIPSDCLGLAYEKLTRQVHGEAKTKTSFFTPLDLINEILDYTKPTKFDSVFDPTCGSAAFLCACISRVFHNCDNQKDLKKYIEQNIFGIDRDWHACQIAKAAIMATYATRLPYDLSKIQKTGLDIPKINIENCDFFDWKAKAGFDIVVGNPPWGSIDSKNVLNPKYKQKLLECDVYQDKNDVCVYIAEKSFALLKDTGRLGLLCKRQVIDGSKHSKFKQWCDGRVEYIEDFGDIKLFNNGAQTVMILGKKNTKISTPNVTMRDKNINNSADISFDSDVTFDDLFLVHKGWESGADEIYRTFAEKFPKHHSVRILAPQKNGFTFLKAKNTRVTAVFSEGNVSKSFIKWLSNEDREILENRAAITRSNKDKYAWPWLLNFNSYKFDDTQTRVIIPRVWSNKRIPSIIDLKGEMIGITSHTILIPKNKTTKTEILVASAWISSSFFHNYALAPDLCKRMNDGGIALYPEYLSRCSIPIASNANQIAKFVDSLLSKKSEVTEVDLLKIDQMFFNALVELGVDMNNVTAADSF